MSVGKAFHMRGTAIEKALSATCSWVRWTTKLLQLCVVLRGSGTLNVEHQHTQLELATRGNWFHRGDACEQEGASYSSLAVASWICCKRWSVNYEQLANRLLQ